MLYVVHHLASNSDPKEILAPTPEQAVVIAHEQHMGNFDRDSYPAFDLHPLSVRGKKSVSCSDWSTFTNEERDERIRKGLAL